MLIIELLNRSVKTGYLFENMNKKPLVSVVLCTYNDELYIRETIDSVLNQTFNDFEFIIWNDGSTDGTEQIVKSYDDARIRYFCHENTGVGRAAQLACEHVKAKYIARIDGDDVCMPERLQKEVEFLEKHPDYVVVSSSVYYVDEDGKVLGRSFPATSNAVLQRMLYYNDPIVHPASMIRTDVFVKSGGYVGIKQSLDHVLFGRLRKYGKVKNLSAPLLRYRLRKSSLSHCIAGSGYDSVMSAYRNKLINDETVNPKDVEIYNRIFAESRSQGIVHDVNRPLHRKTLEEYLYSALGKGKLAESIVFFLKNLYSGIKYRMPKN